MAKSSKKSPKKTQDKDHQKLDDLAQEKENDVVDSDQSANKDEIGHNLPLEDGDILDEVDLPENNTTSTSDDLAESIDDIDWDDFSFDDVLEPGSDNKEGALDTETPIDMNEVTQGFELDESESSEVFSDAPELDKKDEMALLLDEKLEEAKQFIEENKTLSQGILAVVLLILLYWVFSPSNDSSQQEELTKVSEQAVSIDNELKRFEAEFSQLSVDGSNKINELDGKVNVLFETIKDNKEELASQKQAIDELSSTIKALIEQKRSSKAKSRYSHKNAQYTVTAIVPGRVWLRTESGQEFTATVGDKVGELGVIVKIEAHYGRVQTSSGTMIYLGDYDG